MLYWAAVAEYHWTVAVREVRLQEDVAEGAVQSMDEREKPKIPKQQTSV